MSKSTKPLDEFRSDAREGMLLVLYEIYGGNRTSPEISKETGIPEQTVRRYINKLIEREYILSIFAEQRRKRANLWLTKKGINALTFHAKETK